MKEKMFLLEGLSRFFLLVFLAMTGLLGFCFYGLCWAMLLLGSRSFSTRSALS